MGYSRKLRWARWALVSVMATSLSPMAYAKKKPVDSTTGGDSGSGTVKGEGAAQASLKGKLQLAQAKIGQVAAAQEPFDGSTRSQLTNLYSREASDTQTALAKLGAANGDPVKVKAASSDIDTAAQPIRQFLAANSSVSSAVTRRQRIINSELTMIAQSPDRYLTLLKSAGVTDPALSQDKSAVQAAASGSGGKVDGDTTANILAAQSQVRSSLTSSQNTVMDNAVQGGGAASNAPAVPKVPSATDLLSKLKPKGF